MREKLSWFRRPLGAICVLLSLTILSVYVILNAEGRRDDTKEISYRVTIRHYGSDVHEMERIAAIPLEDALSAIPGIIRILTRSENSQVRAYAYFRRNRRGFLAHEDDYYDAVREAAQGVYETLPSSAQRPEISSSGDFRVPFWTAAFYGSNEKEEPPPGALLERVIKPVLNSIEGVGEVEISGPGIMEIIITLDQEKTAALGLSPGGISAFLGNNDAIFRGGNTSYQGLEIPIHIDGRYSDLDALGEALIPLPSGGLVSLKTIGIVREQEREADTLSRLNGKKTSIISITAASGVDKRILSKKIEKEMEKFSSLPLEFRILEDRGAEESAAFRSVLIAALEASFLLVLAIIPLARGKSGGLLSGAICAAAIPIITIISAAILSAAGFPVNRKFLAGLAVGIGGAVDAVFLSAEGFSRTRSIVDSKEILRGIWPPLAAGAATTIAALLPLTEIGAPGDITVIAFALGTVTIVSAALALGLLPPLFLLANQGTFQSHANSQGNLQFKFPKAAGQIKKIRRRITRFFTATVLFCAKKSLVVPVISFGLSIAAILSLSAAGADTSGEWAEDSVYVRIEFEGGFQKEEGDKLLASWAQEIMKNPSVREVQTGARVGSGYALVTYDPDKTDITGMRSFINSKTISGAFIYTPEPSPADRIWNINVSGDDAEKCRELAVIAASLCSSLSFVKETVLNFKEGGPRLTLLPRRDLLALRGISFSFPADTIRRGVYGPVAYKRTGDSGEIDVRLRFGPQGNPEGSLGENDVLWVPLPTALGESIYSGSVMEPIRTADASGITREDRRRTASFSIRTDPGDPRIFREKTMEVLVNLELPPGYKLEFDPQAIREAEELSGKFLNFLWAVLFCFMVIAAAEESLILPLIVLLSVPPSLAIPVLALTLSLTPVSSAAACALVAVSGMTVNASVISAGEIWRRISPQEFSKYNLSAKGGLIYRILRGRISALVATTGTTIAGALPFLLLKEGSNGMLRTLALVTVLGVGTSFLCSITLVPSWMNLYLRIRFRKKKLTGVL